MNRFQLDKAAIVAQLAGDEAVFLMMSDLYLEQVDERLAALRAARQSGDVNVFCREVHTLKGLLATFYDTEGAAAAAALERAIRASRQEDVDGALGEVVARVQEVAAVIRGELGR